jgi:exodeoxyribonuclease X
MSKLIFLDTEATGNEPKKDRLCQVCYKVDDGEAVVGYFKPPIPISIKAMSITHITNKMVEDKEPFEGSEMKRELQALLNEGILVAHTALFDIAMLKNEGMEIPRFIDTLRVARYLDPDNKIPEHNLQYLRYFLELEVPGTAHDAEGDVNVLVALFKRLYQKLPDLDKMIEISSKPTLFKYMLFGKHKGKPLSEVVQSDRRYLEWLLTSMTSNGEADTDEDLIYTLKHYLG